MHWFSSLYSLKELHEPICDDDVIFLEQFVGSPHLGSEPMLYEWPVTFNWHLIRVLSICIEQEPVPEWLSSLKLAFVNSIRWVLRHNDRKVCDSLKEASSDVKVTVALSPSSHEFNNINLQIALEMQIINHDDNLLCFVLGCEYLLSFGNILPLDYFSESIEWQITTHRNHDWIKLILWSMYESVQDHRLAGALRTKNSEVFVQLSIKF
jgi:hypothetical protein